MKCMVEIICIFLFEIKTVPTKVTKYVFRKMCCVYGGFYHMSLPRAVLEILVDEI